MSYVTIQYYIKLVIAFNYFIKNKIILKKCCVEEKASVVKLGGKKQKDKHDKFNQLNVYSHLNE